MVVQRIGEDDGEFTGRVEVWKAARWPLQFLKHKNYWRGCYSWIIHGGANAQRWSFLVHKKCRWQQSERCPSCKTWILDWSTVVLVVNAPIFFEYYLMMSSLLESRCSRSICWFCLTFQTSNSTYIQFLEERLPIQIYLWSLQRP